MTAKETIRALGGQTVLARELGLSVSAVKNWSALNWFPAKHYFKLSAMARQRQIFLDEALFMKGWPNGKAAK